MFLPCRPCCATEGCDKADAVPRSDPKDEGTWVPSGDWPFVTWTFVPNPGDESGNTWFFYGSASTSSANPSATIEEIEDWSNPCNWWSSKTTTPSVAGGLNKRASRLPPVNAVVHIYTNVSTALSDPVTVASAYFWSFSWLKGPSFTTTTAGHNSQGFGAVFTSSNTRNASGSTLLGGGFFRGATNYGTVNNGAYFAQGVNQGTVNGGGTFLAGVNFSTVNDSGTFTVLSRNSVGGTVNGGGTFQVESINQGTVNGGATFSGALNDVSENQGNVYGGATFSDYSKNTVDGTVYDGATFTGNGCSERFTGSFSAVPCTRKFVAHPTDLPTCNGTAPAGCDNAGDTCGCG